MFVIGGSKLKLTNIKTPIQFELWISSVYDNAIISEGMVDFELGNIAGQYIIVQNEKIIHVQLRNTRQQYSLDFHLSRGFARLGYITRVFKDGSALLKINFFNGSVLEMGELEIGIDEYIENAAKRKGFQFRKTEELASLLKQQFVIDVNDDYSYFLIRISGPNFDDNKSVDSEELTHFYIVGEDIRIPIKRRRMSQDLEIFFASRLENNNRVEGLKLAKGNIRFSDYTKTGQIRVLASGSISRLVREQGSYLNQWDKYGATVGKLILKRARDIGKLEYKSPEPSGDAVKFFFEKQLPKNIYVGDHLEIAKVVPVYITNPEITWEEYIELVEDDYRKSKKNESEESIIAEVLTISGNSLKLKLSVIPPNDRFLILSITGDRTQLQRQNKARRLIIEGNCANPLLGLLIEENGEIPEIQRRSRMKALTPLIKEKVFKGNEPTRTQEKAIEIALNTPDIALIQGPPGTGKTTVIAAILERINQEYDKSGVIRGQVLVSAFQHDAVDNIVSRLSINSLPAVKFGRRSRENELEADRDRKAIENWCQDIARKIREKNPRITETEEQRRLSELFHLYAISPSLNNAMNLLNKILEIPRSILSPELVDRTSTLITALSTQVDGSFEKPNVRVLRSLRTSESGFLDDGPERAADVYIEFENTLTEDEQKLLKSAIAWKEGDDLSFLDGIGRMKKRLLDRFIPVPRFKIEKPREDIIYLFSQVSKQFEKNRSRGDKTEITLANFLHELENNPDGARRAIEDYNFVFAATTQQAEGTAIRKAKTRDRDRTIVYDTVIIDEAARTSPRDLLIPMAQAEKRIILVGDHKQLPHILEEEVCSLLESEGDVTSDLEVSLFQHLFERIEKLEKADGVRRKITLDSQFRMHPSLGRLISRFYEKPLQSPLPDTMFSQSLEGVAGVPAAWINVPNESGNERKSGNSRIRKEEAKVIAKQLKKWIDSEEGKNLTFGIITFYKAQVNEIYAELSKPEYGITKSLGSNDWCIVDEYKYLRSVENGKVTLEERLRIGTVDAFQGMEFDVVLLSMVRTRNLNKVSSKIKSNEVAIFGHLTLESRLCVSMSRQKRLLVVVGDSALVDSDIGRKAVPALGDFLDLCLQEGEFI
jgi:hypothetical protein